MRISAPAHVKTAVSQHPLHTVATCPWVHDGQGQGDSRQCARVSEEHQAYRACQLVFKVFRQHCSLCGGASKFLEIQSTYRPRIEQRRGARVGSRAEVAKQKKSQPMLLAPRLFLRALATRDAEDFLPGHNICANGVQCDQYGIGEIVLIVLHWSLYTHLDA